MTPKMRRFATHCRLEWNWSQWWVGLCLDTRWWGPPEFNTYAETTVLLGLLPLQLRVVSQYEPVRGGGFQCTTADLGEYIGRGKE